MAAAANSYGALLTLVLNGYGQDAMKIARSIYETELNGFWLKNHPEDLDDFPRLQPHPAKAVIR